ncbi:MAG: phage tail protein, partial [Pseudomonadota bacterium]
LTPVVVKTADFDAVGEVFWFAGGVAPPGMRVAQNALFTKVGTTSGGAGSSFALPDLRGRGVVGRTFGIRFTGHPADRPSAALQSEDLERHTHQVPATGEATGPARPRSASARSTPTRGSNACPERSMG